MTGAASVSIHLIFTWPKLLSETTEEAQALPGGFITMATSSPSLPAPTPAGFSPLGLAIYPGLITLLH